ncbi:hypothetical protein EDD80_10827 [Anseongella ginsenosidimutans]|uniref:PKD domain-containing protein n=1 Tax=Anseongella ginsenosidimutans TaxID=496056 RepID=A0A4R3KNU1_9SPHI|nr:PKD domain-containing protein [Anseongella ginsenosidimutans]QEC53857.1 hypothetical protein FRZ59_16995 [Anseongella ginsenosidimutans]TCS86236.1 hypothetical protein EDD80_10827 [Anseongella ginsenosidimutans]
MNEYNTYPVFVADQVLTAEHLNQVVNYLDEQGRLTRNRLIGIGIVCGLEIKAGPESIEIGKGCGVTSEGYLVLQERKIYTYSRPYTLPEYFSPEYKPVYEDWHMWELLTAEESLEAEDGQPLKGREDFVKDKIVVLLLEMKEKPLKNCIEIDCEDKGDKIEFRVKPLLVSREDLDEFTGVREPAGELSGGLLRRPAAGLRDVSPNPRLSRVLRDVSENPRHSRAFREAATRGPRFESVPGRRLREPRLSRAAQQDMQLRRFNVPARELKNTNDVFGAFLRIVDESTLKQLAETLNACYYRYQPVLGAENNPFEQVASRFNDTLSHIKTANPYFIQYFYDWIDDIIKAYHELEYKIVDVQTECCPDRDLFPLHLMLGEANRDTTDHVRSSYRHYFIYSPLFNGQQQLVSEVRLLFKRLAAIIETFSVPHVKTLFPAEVKITPSRYLEHPLSERCIPYYYDPGAMYPLWSWEKTRRGRADSNLSYHAGEYSSADTVLNPLNYDIETYNFFRVEGHIGKPVTAALQTLLARRDHFNLPFEALALSTATISAFFNADDHECHFRDLESIYRVLLAEMKCKFGEFQCMAARIPYQARVRAGVLSGGETLAGRAAAFQPGDFLKSHCPPQKGSVGEAYLNLVSRRISFNRFTALDLSAGISGAAGATAGRTGAAAGAASAVSAAGFNDHALYAALFYFIHSVERLFQVLANKELGQLDMELFQPRYEAVVDAAGDLARIGEALERLDAGNENYQALLKRLQELGFFELTVRIRTLIYICLDHRLKALKEEYQRRLRELRLLTNLMHYAKKHPGLEHKAGVPKGGTFIMVYHESPPRRLLAGLTAIGERTVSAAESAAFREAGSTIAERGSFATGSAAGTEELIREAYVNNPQLLRKFEKALGTFMDTCRDMDPDNRKRIRDILVSIPDREEPLDFRVAEEAVIADFYLPYICCSGCASVSYVLPATPEEVLSIRIRPTEFCNDDSRLYPVTVSPAGGKLTASAGGISEENGFAFSPEGLAAGMNTLTYTLADGRSTSVDLRIAEKFQVDFKTRDMGDLTVQFIPGFTDEENRQVSWDFGDGATSAEFSPRHTYRLEESEASFVVTLRVNHASCMAEAKQTITLRKPADPQFDLQPRVFCVNDRKEYEFSIEPFPETIEEIKNPDKLIISMDAAAGKMDFVPARHRIKSTKDYRLEYMGTGLDLRVVVADASFIMQIKWMDTDNLLVLKPRQTDASGYTWTITQGRISRSFTTQVVEVKQSELGLSPRLDFSISLHVNHQLPSGNCANEQKFTMTPQLFRKYQGSGEEFDNSTIQ